MDAEQVAALIAQLRNVTPRHVSGVPVLEQAAAALEALARENAELQQLIDIGIRGRSPCGHWKAYAYTEDGGKQITCLYCRSRAAEQQLADCRAQREAEKAQRKGQ